MGMACRTGTASLLRQSLHPPGSAHAPARRLQSRLRRKTIMGFQPFHAAAGALALALAGPLAAQDIDTRAFGGSFSYGPLVEEVQRDDRTVANAGQTFVAPAGKPILDTFSFFLSANGKLPNSGDLQFRAYVLPWDHTALRPTGLPIWSSATRSGASDPSGYANPDDGGGWTEYAFDTGGLVLDPAQMYLAMLSAVETPAKSLHQNGTVGVAANVVRGIYPWVPGGGYPDGYWVYGESRYLDGAGTPDIFLDLPNLQGLPYTSYYGIEGDLAFTASFSAVDTTVPEPVSMALLGTGLAGVAAARRRRRRDDH